MTAIATHLAQALERQWIAVYSHSKHPSIFVADFNDVGDLDHLHFGEARHLPSRKTRDSLYYCIRRDHPVFHFEFRKNDQWPMMQRAYASTQGWDGGGRDMQDFLDKHYCLQGSGIPQAGPAPKVLQENLVALIILSAGLTACGAVGLIHGIRELITSNPRWMMRLFLKQGTVLSGFMFLTGAAAIWWLQPRLWK